MTTDEELRCKNIINRFSEGEITIDDAELLVNAIVGMTEGIERLHCLIRKKCGQTMDALHIQNQRLRLELSTLKHKESRKQMHDSK